MADNKPKNLSAASPPLDLENVDETPVPGRVSQSATSNQFTELGLLVQGFGALGADPGAQAIGKNLVDLGKELQEQQRLERQAQQKFDLSQLKFDAKAKEQEASGQAIINTAKDLVTRGLLTQAQFATVTGQVQAGRVQDASKTLGVAATTPQKLEHLKNQIKLRQELTQDVFDDFNKLVAKGAIDPSKPANPKSFAAALKITKEQAKGLIDQLQEQGKILPDATIQDTVNAASEFLTGTKPLQTPQQQFLQQRQEQIAGAGAAAGATTAPPPGAKTQFISRTNELVPAGAKNLPPGASFRISTFPDTVFKLTD